MPAIAIDLAVLLPREPRAIVERVNTGLAGDGIRFDASHHPHVTLSQHFVNRDQLSHVRIRATTVISEHPPLDLHVTGTRSGRTTLSLVVSPTSALQRLHEQLMDTLSPYEVPGYAGAFQQDDDPPRDADVAWVTRFRAEASFERFDPHITAGVGAAPVTVAPFTFAAREIALCRLGRFCTYRNLLARWTL